MSHRNFRQIRAIKKKYARSLHLNLELAALQWCQHGLSQLDGLSWICSIEVEVLGKHHQQHGRQHQHILHFLDRGARNRTFHSPDTP